MTAPAYVDDFLTVYGGDCRAVLADLEAETINTVVTSPPYWGLRDYGVPGQLGLEPALDDYLEAMVDVFRSVRRVLRRDGTVWLNLGDSYVGTEAKSPNIREDGSMSYRAHGRKKAPGRGLKAKDRAMVPARVAIALQADGWWVRDEVVWSKPNPMPTPIRDRTIPAHEMVYLLSRSARYYYDVDAIREPHTTTSDRRKVKVPGGWEVDPGRHDRPNRKGRTSATYRDKTLDTPALDRRRQAPEPGEANAFHPLGRNRRSVWTVATEAYPDAHFATFPRRLIEPMIVAGAPPGGLVLDPFAGSGTVGLVAQAVGRRAVLVDLNPEYVRQSLRRASREFGVGGSGFEDAGDAWPEGSLWHVTEEAP